MGQKSLMSDILRAEIECTADLLDLLRKENQALRGADPDTLDKITGAKQSVVRDIQASLFNHEGFLRNSGMPVGRDGVSAYLATLPSDAPEHDQWAQLQALARQCQTQNEVNAVMLAAIRRRAQQALNILRGAPGGDHTYGPRGETNKRNSSQTIAKA